MITDFFGYTGQYIQGIGCQLNNHMVKVGNELVTSVDQRIQEMRRDLREQLETIRRDCASLEVEIDNTVRQTDFSPKIKDIIIKAYKAVPEAYLIGCMIVGDGPFVFFAGAARILVAALPLIQNALRDDVSDTDTAMQGVSENMKDMLKKLHVGLVIASAVAAVAMGVFGWFDPTLTAFDIIARTAFWVLVSSTALITCDIDDAREQMV